MHKKALWRRNFALEKDYNTLMRRFVLLGYSSRCFCNSSFMTNAGFGYFTPRHAALCCCLLKFLSPFCT
ncbi:hypothetical protein F0562_032756 [Nyssa sinensis]|uniref:Uncharacterized protein n=1 Tax=Nyssa sinensis TaxID=561372 RepID=A0A5J5ANY1_9ASTE|nr:hypothetical protein F0562_032756 [Nyssa sinensis]